MRPPLPRLSPDALKPPGYHRASSLDRRPQGRIMPARLPPKTERCLTHCPQLRHRVAGHPALFRPAFTISAI